MDIRWTFSTTRVTFRTTTLVIIRYVKTHVGVTSECSTALHGGPYVGEAVGFDCSYTDRPYGTTVLQLRLQTGFLA
jgi:hypothetical protein